jgi:lysophospholipase L1-like esterase
MKRLLKQCLTLSIILLIAVPVDAQSFESCPDNAKALVPDTLQEEWAVEWWMPRHEAKLAEDGRDSARLLFIGNSITHGWETTGKEIWDEVFAPYGAYNIGFSGDRTENVLWRLQQGEVDGISPELAILMIGTNNTGHRQDPPECTARGIRMILDELQERLPETQVLLLAIFPRQSSPDGDLRLLNDEINSLIAGFVDDERVSFLNINNAFLNQNGTLSEEIMPDLLHPNETGYRLWADAIKDTVEELVKD